MKVFFCEVNFAVEVAVLSAEAIRMILALQAYILVPLDAVNNVLKKCKCVIVKAKMEEKTVPYVCIPRVRGTVFFGMKTGGFPKLRYGQQDVTSANRSA